MTPNEQLAQSLFDHIKHGDEVHQAWLKAAALEWVEKEFGKVVLDDFFFGARLAYSPPDASQLKWDDEPRTATFGPATDQPMTIDAVSFNGFVTTVCPHNMPLKYRCGICAINKDL